MKRTALTALLLAGLVSGCASNVKMAMPTIPAPLIDKIPVSVGLRMPANFESYVHEESVYGREEWSIDLGRSNAALFTQLFGYMFDSVTVLDEDDDPKLMGLDALIEPSIDAFEFSTPSQSRTEAFAVWIRYRLRVFDREGRHSDFQLACQRLWQESGHNDGQRQRPATCCCPGDARCGRAHGHEIRPGDPDQRAGRSYGRSAALCCGAYARSCRRRGSAGNYT